jgi:hypothetical protein
MKFSGHFKRTCATFQNYQESTPKKFKGNPTSKGLELVDSLHDRVTEWLFEEVLGDDEFASTHPVKMAMFNLEGAITESILTAKKKLKELKLVKNILECKKAVKDKDGYVIEDPMYLVQWQDESQADSWIPMKELSDDSEVVKTFWKDLGVEFTK